MADTTSPLTDPTTTPPASTTLATSAATPPTGVATAGGPGTTTPPASAGSSTGIVDTLLTDLGSLWSGFTNYVSSNAGNLAAFTGLGAAGLYEAHNAQQDASKYAGQLQSIGAPYVAAGQQQLGAFTGAAPAADAQQIAGAGTLGDIANQSFTDYQSGKLPPAYEQQLTDQATAAKAQLRASLGPNVDSSTLATQDEAIDQQMNLNRQQLLDQRLQIGEQAYQQVQGAFNNLLNEALGAGSLGLNAEAQAIGLKISSDTQIAAALTQMFGAIAQGYGAASAPAAGGTAGTPAAGGTAGSSSQSGGLLDWLKKTFGGQGGATSVPGIGGPVGTGGGTSVPPLTDPSQIGNIDWGSFGSVFGGATGDLSGITGSAPTDPGSIDFGNFGSVFGGTDVGAIPTDTGAASDVGSFFLGGSGSDAAGSVGSSLVNNAGSSVGSLAGDALGALNDLSSLKTLFSGNASAESKFVSGASIINPIAGLGAAAITSIMNLGSSGMNIRRQVGEQKFKAVADYFLEKGLGRDPSNVLGWEGDSPVDTKFMEDFATHMAAATGAKDPSSINPFTKEGMNTFSRMDPNYILQQMVDFYDSQTGTKPEQGAGTGYYKPIQDAEAFAKEHWNSGFGSSTMPLQLSDKILNAPIKTTEEYLSSIRATTPAERAKQKKYIWKQKVKAKVTGG